MKILLFFALFGFSIALGCSGSPIMKAIMEDNLKDVKNHYKEGMDVNSKMDNGKTPLILAAEKTNNPEIINFLLEKGALIEAKDSEGKTALMHAAAKGSVPIVQLILSRGGNPNSQANNGFTPLFFAIGESQIQIVKMLLVAGAEINYVSRHGDNPLSWAAGSGDIGIVSLFLDNGAEVNLKGSAKPPLRAASNQPEILRVLLEKGALVEKGNRYGGTPLMGAALNGNQTSINTLLEFGADPNAHTKHVSALTIAAQLGHIDVVKILINSKVDVNWKNSAGATAIFFAVGSCQKEITQVLIDAGAEVTIRDIGGHSLRDVLNKQLYTRCVLAGEFNPSLYNILLEAGVPE